MLQGLESFCIPTERKIQPGGGGRGGAKYGKGIKKYNLLWTEVTRM